MTDRSGLVSRHIHRSSVFALAIGIAAVSIGCAAAPRSRPVKMGDVDTGPGSLVAARGYLEGTWNLVSFEVHSPNQPTIRLNGPGTLKYDAFGNLDMELHVDDKAAGLLERAGVASSKGLISANGRTSIDLNKRTLTYIVDPNAAPPALGPLALNRPRHWVVEGNTLVLTTKDEKDQTLSVGRWQKAAP